MLTSYLSRIGLLVFVGAWLAPNHFRPWVNFHSEMLALAAIGLFFIVYVVKNQGNASSVPRQYLWLALVALIPWLQLYAGVFRYGGDAVVSSLYLFGLVAAMMIGYFCAQSNHQSPLSLSNLMHALWIAALLSASIGLLQWLELESALQMYAVNRSKDGRAMGNLGQPNQLASLLLIGIVALVYAFETRVINRFTLFFSAGFLSFVIVLTQSRTALLGVLAITLFYVWKRRRLELRLGRQAAVLWAAGFGIATFLFPYLNDALLLADVRAVNGLDAVNERYLIWQQVLYGISQSPWLGYGWNHTATAQLAGVLAFPGNVPVNYAHNFVLDMMAWNGVLLGFVLSGAIGLWFISRIKSVKSREAVFAMAILLPIAIHSMLEYPFAYSYFLLTAGLMAGVVEASIQSNRLINLSKPLIGSICAFWILIGTYLAYEYMLIEEDFRVARFENLKVGQTPVGYQKPDILMSTQLAAMLKATRQPALPGMDQSDIDNLREVASRFTYGPSTFKYAVALGLNNDPKEASRQMLMLRGLYGERYYQAAKAHLRLLQEEKYPQLGAIVLP